jgi:hypothetical protein
MLFSFGFPIPRAMRRTDLMEGQRLRSPLRPFNADILR